MDKKSFAATAIFALSLLLLFFLYFMDRSLEKPNYAILALTGPIVTVGVLALLGISYNLIGQSNTTQAFGLPDGTIRTIIALSLIVMFIFMCFYLYDSFIPKVTEMNGVYTDEQKNALTKAVGEDYVIWRDVTSDNKKSYAATLVYKPSATLSEFAKQIFVLMGTLVTSVTSFYFGSAVAKSSASATGETGTPEIKLKGITPATYTRAAAPGACRFSLSGQNLDTVKSVAISFGTTQLTAKFSLKNSTEAECEIVIDVAQPPGDWDVIVTDKAGRPVELSHVLKVT